MRGLTPIDEHNAQIRSWCSSSFWIIYPCEKKHDQMKKTLSPPLIRLLAGRPARRVFCHCAKRGSTNERGSLRMDLRLTQGFGREADPVRYIGEFQLGKQVEQGRLVKSRRVLCPYREIFSRFALTITPWLFTLAIRR